MDDDVQLEVRRVESGRANGAALRATHLCKVFPAVDGANVAVAVADVTFGCSVGECLGFLGAFSLHRLLFDKGNPLPASFPYPSLGDMSLPFLPLGHLLPQAQTVPGRLLLCPCWLLLCRPRLGVYRFAIGTWCCLARRSWLTVSLDCVLKRTGLCLRTSQVHAGACQLPFFENHCG